MAETENTNSSSDESTIQTGDAVSINEQLTAAPDAEGPVSDEVQDAAANNPETNPDDVSRSLKVVSDTVGTMKSDEGGGDNQPDEGNDDGDDNQPDDENDSPDNNDEGSDNQPDDSDDAGDSEGGIVTSVNEMITDSASQSNVEVVGGASAIAMAQLYIATSQALSLAAENAVADQQQANSLAMTALTKAVANITGKKK